MHVMAGGCKNRLQGLGFVRIRNQFMECNTIAPLPPILSPSCTVDPFNNPSRGDAWVLQWKIYKFYLDVGKFSCLSLRVIEAVLAAVPSPGGDDWVELGNTFE